MKTPAFKPGFEFIFTLSILAVLGLPPLVSAQAQTKDLQININNGDTTVNGKNIKDLTADERKDALKNIKQIATINDDNGPQKMVIVTRKQKGDKSGDEIVVEKKGFGESDEPLIADNDVNTNGKKIKRMNIRIRRNGNDSTMAYITEDGGPKHRMEVHDFRMERDDERPMGFNRRNTQNFVYTNTDNEGISTRVSYRVSEHPATLDHEAGKVEKSQLEMLDVNDLTLAPEFSAGKTVLMFSLPSKAAAEVKLKDTNGNLLWSEKAINGKFNKSFPLGLNGLYYLQIKQGNKIAVKEIRKD